jgi:hypothetical protein
MKKIKLVISRGMLEALLDGCVERIKYIFKGVEIEIKTDPKKDKN